jgi:predicted DsbA family dithiol-disulfide isomerase
VQLVHFPLHPDTPMDGQSLEQLFAGRDVDVEAMYARMKGLMETEGLPYGRRTHTYNSRLAQELGKWADTQPNGYAIHDALYKAYFVEAKNIGDIDVLLDVVRAVGLDEKTAREVLEQRTFKSEVDADWTKSRQFGVTGVPTFAAGGYGVVGAQPYEAIEELVKNAGAASRGDNAT